MGSIPAKTNAIGGRFFTCTPANNCAIDLKIAQQAKCVMCTLKAQKNYNRINLKFKSLANKILQISKVQFPEGAKHILAAKA